MKILLLTPVALAGCAMLAVSVWQLSLNNEPDLKRIEEGNITWTIPQAQSSPGLPSLPEAHKILFQTKVTYPEEVEVGEGFQILLSSSPTKKNNSDSDSQNSESQQDYHEFELQLPGLQSQPAGQNRVGVDGHFRWQVAPPRVPGVYRGYLQPGSSSVVFRGGQITHEWNSPEDFQLTVTVKQSFRLLEQGQALLVGFLGSLFSFPALFGLYKHFKTTKQ